MGAKKRVENKSITSNDKVKAQSRSSGAALLRERDLPQRSQSVHSRLSVANSKVSQNNQQQPSTAFGRGGASKTPSSERRPNSMQMAPTVTASRREYDNATAAKKGVVSRNRSQDTAKSAIAPGGFAKLLEIRKPVVVTHETEGGYANAGGNAHGGVRKSMELRGESEHLYIGGEETDVISEDQLDRLLLQAKKAKATGSKR